jgi:hypothetical protein
MGSLSYLVQMTDAGSVPRSTTNLKGSDSLRALFLGRNPRATRGSGHMCCGWLPAETPEIGHFLGQSRLYSPFGLRVGADGGLYESTTYDRRFVVNQGHQSTGLTGPITLVPIEIDDKGNGCGDEGRTVRIGVVDAHDQGRREV